jgi:hypothetical protein
MSHFTVVSVIQPFSEVPALQNAGDYTGKAADKQLSAKKNPAV